MQPYSTISTRQQGFTLVELIMVIVLMGVIGGIMSVFMRGPIDAYFSSARRAALTDVADTTVRRIARDLRRALPNSIRSNATCANSLEFIPTKTGGRYRVDGTNALTFSAPVLGFNMLGDNATFAGAALPNDQIILAGDLVVVYNLGIAGADAYLGNNTALVSAVTNGTETNIALGAVGKQFPLASGSNRFHVVSANEQIVTYVCNGTTLYRTATASMTAPTSCTAGSVIATNVDCTGTSFAFSPTDLQRNAIVTMVLSIQDSTATETVNLQHEVHVDNTP
jgi:MSHA biogenesis protein MshO